MKWSGYTRTSPVDPTPGVLDTAINTRLAVEGEVRNRRGMARSSLAKISGAVKGISDFAFAPGLPYAVVLGNGAVDGSNGISSQWGDSHLTALSGASTPDSGTTYTLVVNRNGCSFADGGFIYADEPGFPTDSSASVLVDFIALDPSVESNSISWTAPYSASWRFRVYPRHLDQLGPGANLTACTSSLTWSPTNKGPGVTLSLNNIRATCTLGDSVYATVGWATGKHQVEYVCRAIGANAGRVGYTFAGINLSGALGDDPFGFGWSAIGPYWNNAFSGGSFSTFTVGDILGVRYDATGAGVVTLSKNGSDVGNFTIGIGTIYPAVSDGAVGGTSTFDIVPVSLTYPVSGYSPWASLT